MRKRLIFFCPIKRQAVGGIKVIYQIAEQCGRSLESTMSSYVFHPNQPWFKCKWFKNDVKFLQGFLGVEWRGKPSLTSLGKFFDKDSDFVVLPELWVRKYGPQLIELGVPYAILVQGGYLIGSGDRRVIRKAYDEAKVILTNSEKSTQLVKYAFPSVSMKIRRVYLKIDPTSFTPAQKKDNLITYMPRRLPEHANYLKFLLHDKLPSDWQLAAIDKLNEQEVANILSKSKIFLSFSDREGFGLPPLEAALAGNVVIGYTGEAGREYWRSPLFIEIMQGDLLTMAETVLEVANRKENLLHDQVLMMIAQLRETYSPEAFKHSVEQFISEYVLRN